MGYFKREYTEKYNNPRFIRKVNKSVYIPIHKPAMKLQSKYYKHKSVEGLVFREVLSQNESLYFETPRLIGESGVWGYKGTPAKDFNKENLVEITEKEYLGYENLIHLGQN